VNLSLGVQRMCETDLMNIGQALKLVLLPSISGRESESGRVQR